MADRGDPRRMQFASEFEWISPSGRGLLTHYMPAHYAAGWWMDSAPTLMEAEQATYQLFLDLKSVALTRHILLPVGTDYTPPNVWVTEIHRDWNSRYTWPRFRCALPREFFAAVRADSQARGLRPSPQTRDMNPIYTGKDVSYIDTKQANRAAESAVLAAERFAVFASLLTGARYPEPALAKAWVQLAYGAHHDAITGSESDQVYLDLLTGWRDAWDLGTTIRDRALGLLSRAVASGPESVVVWNSLAHERSDIVTVRLATALGPGVKVTDSAGTAVPCLVEHDGHSVSWRAERVGSLGWRSYHLTSISEGCGWESVDGVAIENEYFRLRVDPGRGGAVESLVDLRWRRTPSWAWGSVGGAADAGGRELIAAGRVGNELAVYTEYSAHPEAGEGPWHLLPAGPIEVSSARPADSVRAYRSALGERLEIRGRIGGLLSYTQVLTLWRGIARLDCSVTVDEFTGMDRLVRLRWPCPVPGAMPVSEVGDAVIGRGFGLIHDPVAGGARAVDTAKHPWTLDNPAHGWFGLSAPVVVRSGGTARAIAVAEVVVPTEDTAGELVRDLMVALVRVGVTATCSGADRPRYGDLNVDSNLPDVRIVVGGPDENAFAAAVLEAADPAYGDELRQQLAATGQARVFLAPAAPLREVWKPDADLRDVLALPVLILAGTDLVGVVAAAVDDLEDAVLEVEQRVPAPDEAFEARTVALINRGVPGFSVESDGTLHSSLLRSCTGWPSGVWIDPPRRTAPDGSNFQLQHWTHTFDFALLSGPGDWRDLGICTRSAEFNNPLIGLPTGSAEIGVPIGSPVIGVPIGSPLIGEDGTLMTITPSGSVHLAALKAAGNPTATGSAAEVTPDHVTLRLTETRGAPAEVEIASSLGSLSAPVAADLLEQPRSTETPLRLHGYQIATVQTRIEVPRLLDAEHVQLGMEAEAAQPLYARYWLHNRGPAPIGGLPVVAHLHPEILLARPAERVKLRLTVASDCTDAPLSGVVRLRCPSGWSADRPEIPFDLPVRGYREADVVLSVPPDADPGDYPIRAQLQLTGAPAAWRQVVEDVCVVTVSAKAAGQDQPRGGSKADGALVRLSREPSDIVVRAGETGRLVAAVTSGAMADLAVEAHLISPWGTWDWLGPPAQGAELSADSTVEFNFHVTPPPWTAPGRWWAVIRVGSAGRLLYTPAVSVTVQ
jgi:alpha-mannosidase